MRAPFHATRALALLLLAACPGPGPGVGPRAQAGYEAATPVIEALARFHAANGAYPDSLAQLVPQYLREGALAEPNPGYPWEYRSVSSGRSYNLRFRYSGPGMNFCDWTPDTRAWDCGGYY